MIKWIVIIAIAAGAVWYVINKKERQAAVTIETESIETTSSTPAPAGSSRTPTEEQCRSVGGRIIEGMGCVVGAPETSANPHISPAEMESLCRQNNQRYVQELNACVSD
ncbi:MAG TPA: hypothetical protein VJU83_01525 [Burkholderiales bacterium]|nr:hypothetical protein [Burkholderiales bacterium]